MRRILIYIYFALFCCSRLMAQAQYEQLLHKTYAQRIDLLKAVIDKIAIADPDSASVFQHIARFREFAQAHHDKDLVLEADMMGTYFLTYHRYHNVRQVVAGLTNVIKEAAAKGVLTTQARAMASLADYYFNVQGNYELSFETYFQLEKLLQQIPYQTFPDKLEEIYDIGAAYYFFSDYSHTMHYCKLALQFKPVGFNVRVFNSARNTLGLCYRALGKLDSSDYYFSLLVNKKDPAHMDVWENIAKGNLGYNDYLRGEYEKAMPLFRADINSAIKQQDWGLASGSLMPLAEIYFKQNRNAEAEKMVWRAKQYVARSGQYRRYGVLYPLMSRMYTINGQARLAGVYLDSAMYVKDSLARMYSALLLLRAKQKVDAQQRRAEIDKLDAEKAIRLLQRDVLMAFALILAISAIFITWIQKKRHRQHELLLELQLDNQKKELAAAAARLTEFTQSISGKNRLIETLESQFGGDSQNIALEQLRQATIITDEGWEQFRVLFGRVHTGYLQRLKEKLPGLTPAETRLMALARLQLSNKEMAAVLGVSAQNIRTIWYRLRKKLGLPEEGTIKSLTDSI